MKIGIVSGAYFGFEENAEGLARMKKHGYDCMDFSSLADTERCGLYQLSQNAFIQKLAELKDMINSAGISVSQTHGPWRYPPRDATEADRKERFEKMQKAIYATKLLGSPYFVIHPIMPFGSNENPRPERFWELNKEFLIKLAEEGKKNDVTVCLENMPMINLTISSPAATLKMIKEINSPWLKMCLDTGHSAVMGTSPGDAVRMIGKELLACMHVHDNDGKRDCHWVPFTGAIDWNDFSKSLYEIGYEGVLSLETQCSNMIHAPDSLHEHFESGVAKIAKRLSEMP